MSLTPWLEITIVGFVYTVSLFLLLLLSIRKYNLNIDSRVRDHLPFIAILIVFTSYVVGQAMHLLMQKGSEMVYRAYEYKADQQIQIFL